MATNFNGVDGEKMKALLEELYGAYEAVEEMGPGSSDKMQGLVDETSTGLDAAYEKASQPYKMSLFDKISTGVGAGAALLGAAGVGGGGTQRLLGAIGGAGLGIPRGRKKGYERLQRQGLEDEVDRLGSQFKMGQAPISMEREDYTRDMGDAMSLLQMGQRADFAELAEQSKARGTGSALDEMRRKGMEFSDLVSKIAAKKIANGVSGEVAFREAEGGAAGIFPEGLDPYRKIFKTTGTVEDVPSLSQPQVRKRAEDEYEAKQESSRNEFFDYVDGDYPDLVKAVNERAEAQGRDPAYADYKKLISEGGDPSGWFNSFDPIKDQKLRRLLEEAMRFRDLGHLPAYVDSVGNDPEWLRRQQAPVYKETRYRQTGPQSEDAYPEPPGF